MIEWLRALLDLTGSFGATLLMAVLMMGLFAAAAGPFFIFRDNVSLHRGLWKSAGVGEWFVRQVGSLVAVALFLCLFGTSWVALDAVGCQAEQDPKACLEGD